MDALIKLVQTMSEIMDESIKRTSYMVAQASGGVVSGAKLYELVVTHEALELLKGWTTADINYLIETLNKELGIGTENGDVEATYEALAKHFKTTPAHLAVITERLIEVQEKEEQNEQ